MEIYTMSLELKNQYCQHDNITQGNLQIEHNTYQWHLTMAFYKEWEQIKKIFFAEKQKTPNSQSNLKKEKTELEESGSLSLDSTTKLQSSKQYGTGTKTEIIDQWNRIENSKIDPTHLSSVNVWQRRQEYTVEKRQLLQ